MKRDRLTDKVLFVKTWLLLLLLFCGGWRGLENGGCFSSAGHADETKLLLMPDRDQLLENGEVGRPNGAPTRGLAATARGSTRSRDASALCQPTARTKGPNETLDSFRALLHCSHAAGVGT